MPGSQIRASNELTHLPLFLLARLLLRAVERRVDGRPLLIQLRLKRAYKRICTGSGVFRPLAQLLREVRSHLGGELAARMLLQECLHKLQDT